MTLFWILCALLALLAVAFVALPLLRASRIDTGPARAALNAEVYRDHLLELDRELADGVLSVEQHAIARAELDRRALAEAAVPGAAADSVPAVRRGRWLTSGMLALVPVLAFAGYLSLGNPAALNRFFWQTEDGGEAYPPLASKVTGVKLKPGMRVRLETPGGGGYGEPAAACRAE
jgi:cytochrome c-type biogenesis protein CcmI